MQNIKRQIIEVDQRSDDWLKIRLGRFGGTDAQAVATAGKGLETLCYQKVAEIMTGRGAESYTNPDMERGVELEQTARLNYEIETSNQVKTVGYIAWGDYVGVSPDGLISEKGLVEFKCPNDANFIKFLHLREIAPAYKWQVQHQMLVAEREWCDFVVFNDNLNRSVITRINRDEIMINKLQIGLSIGIDKIKNILEEIK